MPSGAVYVLHSTFVMLDPEEPLLDPQDEMLVSSQVGTLMYFSYGMCPLFVAPNPVLLYPSGVF